MHAHSLERLASRPEPQAGRLRPRVEVSRHNDVDVLVTNVFLQEGRCPDRLQLTLVFQAESPTGLVVDDDDRPFRCVEPGDSASSHEVVRIHPRRHAEVYLDHLDRCRAADDRAPRAV